MSLIYNISKSKDVYKLEVSQETNYKLIYTSSNDEELITELDLDTNSSTYLNTLKDGNYTIRLNATGEDQVEHNITVTKYLQESINEDIYEILCNTCANDECYKTLSKQDKITLKNKNIFNKILTYQNIYISTYGDNYLSTFSNYLEKSSLLSKCNVQLKINDIYLHEIISGSSKSDEELFSIYLFIYWAGIYFLEKDLINSQDTEELEYLKDKFYYNEIINCSCDLCFNIQDLEEIFNTTLNILKIYSFQLNTIEENINDILDVNYDLDEHSEESILSGKNIKFNKIAKFGFLIENKQENPYQIFDMFNTDITNEFDYLYQNNKSYYLSKNYISHSNIYFKFVKN